MKIVFNYNNSDFPYPSRAPLFQPSFSTISPGNFVQKKIPFRTWSSPKICTANSHNVARWLPGPLWKQFF